MHLLPPPSCFAAIEGLHGIVSLLPLPSPPQLAVAISRSRNLGFEAPPIVARRRQGPS
ncbi:hypothetical protein BDA96_10G271500 [Sorghum bicolor]|uniref:Uncharacterized protein n=2 Tax=Sorghum bicolor TaxID=4558 RepID=A0A194YLM1_SORBI|nr:hypothetical protein BDA96_10G271500 [Sorghum bicolor]KXG20491.1 hypothetical protein SORBI_3010G208500 [Sorghum bicolor]KXG20492.1 hypothetical protein SORBI_3010G208500 [Sorghum bicolor]